MNDNITQAYPLQREDLYPGHQHLFSDNAKIAFSNNSIPVFDQGTGICLRVRTPQVPLAINELISTINDLADRQYIKEFLIGLSAVSLIVSEQEHQQTTVFSWPVLTEEGLLYCKMNYFKLLLDENYSVPLTEM